MTPDEYDDEIYVLKSNADAFSARLDYGSTTLAAFLPKLGSAPVRQTALVKCLADLILAETNAGADRQELTGCAVADLVVTLRKLDPDACPADLVAFYEKFEREPAIDARFHKKAGPLKP